VDCDSWFELEERGLQFPSVREAVFGIADEGLVDDGCEGKEFVYPLFHDGENLAVTTLGRQVSVA
jgi:hypothetical protein